MELEDISKEDEHKLDKQTENELEKNIESINKSDSSASDKNIISKLNSSDDSITAKEENKKYKETNSENNPEENAVHIAKKLKIDTEIEEIKYNDQDKNQNLSNESEGYSTDFMSTEVEDDDTIDYDCDSNVDISTDSELYAKNIKEENVDVEDDDTFEETDEDCTSISDQSSIKTDDDFVYENIISPVEEQNENGNHVKEEETKTDIKSEPSNQEVHEKEAMEICDHEDWLSVKSDESFIDESSSSSEADYDADTEDSTDDSDTDSDDFFEEDFRICLDICKGLRLNTIIFDVIENAIELEFKKNHVRYSSSDEYDTLDEKYNFSNQKAESNMEISENENLEPSKTDQDKDEEQKSDPDKNESIESIMKVLVSDEDDKLIDKATEKNDSSSNIENNNMKLDAELNKVDEDDKKNHQENELPVLNELESEILDRFFQSNNELENIVQETLQNQEYEYDV